MICGPPGGGLSRIGRQITEGYEEGLRSSWQVKEGDLGADFFDDDDDDVNSNDEEELGPLKEKGRGGGKSTWLVPVHLPPANRATLNGVYSSAVYFGVGIAALSVLRRVVASELYLYLNLYRV